MLFTRRTALLALLAASSDASDTSPWMVKTRATMAGTASETPFPLPRVTRSSSVPGGNSIEMGSNDKPESGAPPATDHSGPVAFYGEVIVTWESAEPIRLERHTSFPPRFDNYYAIGVNGLPLQSMHLVPAELKATAIEVSLRKRERTDYALTQAHGKTLLFAFQVRSFPLAFDDRFVTFRANLNGPGPV